MRIRVPVEMLNEETARLTKMEAVIKRNDGILKKAWSSLPIESRSRQTIEARINHSRSMAGFLSGQTQNMGNYLNQVGVRFVEADCRCSDGLYKQYAGNASSSAFVPGSDLDTKGKYRNISTEHDRLSLGIGSGIAIAGGLAWIGKTCGFYGSFSFLPGAGKAKLVDDTIDLSLEVKDIYDQTKNSKDIYDIAGHTTSIILTNKLALVGGTAVKFAVGAAIIGTGVAATAPFWAITAVAVGAGIAVGVGISAVLNISIVDKSISSHIGDAVANVYRSVGEVASNVGSNAVQAGANMVDAVSSSIQSVVSNVGAAVEGTGQVIKGIGEKLKFW